MLTINRSILHSSLTRAVSAALCVLASCATASSATIASVTLSFAGYGSPSYVGNDLSTATSVTFAPLTVVTDVPAFYLGTTPNDFFTSGSVLMGSFLEFADLSLLLPGPKLLPMTSSWIFGNDGQYKFNLRSASVSSAGTGTLNLDFFGTFHDGTGRFVDNTAEARIGLTQTGFGAISESGTFASPPITTNATPEPRTGCLIGAVLLFVSPLCRRSFLGKTR